MDVARRCWNIGAVRLGDAENFEKIVCASVERQESIDLRCAGAEVDVVSDMFEERAG